MKNKFSVLLCLTIPLVALRVSAGTVNIPADEPIVSVTVPDSWDPEETDDGIAVESPDKVATLFLEVTSAKAADALIDENVDWLMKEQKVDIDEKSQQSKDFKTDGLAWKRISWEGKSDEFGASDVGFLFADAGEGKVLTITYWITKKDREKHGEELDRILESVKRIGS